MTFLSFLFFSLPIFWVAVLLKQFVAIGFNDFLSDPQIAPWIIPILAVISGLIWMSILPGKGRRKLITFAAAALASRRVGRTAARRRRPPRPRMATLAAVTIMCVSEPPGLARREGVQLCQQIRVARPEWSEGRGLQQRDSR